MNKKRKIMIYLLAILSIISLFPQCSNTIETKINFITDTANLLSDSQKENIQKLLSDHNHKHLGRIFLKIIIELPRDTSIEQYAFKTINERPLSANERNDRILVVIALKNRIMRIETSMDVWRILDDESCSETIKKKFTPSFKENNYYQGIELGLKTIIDKLERS